jgi:hypothetical protein
VKRDVILLIIVAPAIEVCGGRVETSIVVVVAVIGVLGVAFIYRPHNTC